MNGESIDRRRLLQVGGASLMGLAGCLGGDDEDSVSDEEAPPSTESSSDSSEDGSSEEVDDSPDFDPENDSVAELLADQSEHLRDSEGFGGFEVSSEDYIGPRGKVFDTIKNLEARHDPQNDISYAEFDVAESISSDPFESVKLLRRGDEIAVEKRDYENDELVEKEIDYNTDVTVEGSLVEADRDFPFFGDEEAVWQMLVNPEHGAEAYTSVWLADGGLSGFADMRDLEYAGEEDSPATGESSYMFEDDFDTRVDAEAAGLPEGDMEDLIGTSTEFWINQDNMVNESLRYSFATDAERDIFYQVDMTASDVDLRELEL